MKLQRKLQKRIRRVLLYLAVLLLVLVVIIPYLWMISSSFKSTLEIQGMEPRWIPHKFTLENYEKVNAIVPIFSYFKNSFIISTGTMIGTVLLAVFAAYALSRFRFRGKNFYSITLFSTQMLPGILFLIPYFVIFIWIQRNLGIQMKNTYYGMIFTYISFSLPFSILMLVNYLDSIPQEIDQQAMIDGCSRVQALFKVVLPLAKPGIAAVGIYSFIMAWNEILFSKILTGTETKTVALGLLQYIGAQQSRWGSMMAACILTTIPVLILFTSMQKQIVEGLVSGATKG